MLTILIPTFNRDAFVVRSLGYYASVGCPYAIVVADSSDDQHCPRTRALIGQLAGRLDVSHRRFPQDFGNYQCLQAVLREIETPYVAVIGDDDLLVPGALGEAAAFLDRHPEHSGVVGNALTVRTENDSVIGRITETGRYATGARAEPRAVDRVLRYIDGGDSIDYALMRLEDRRRSVDAAVESGLYRKYGFFGELANVIMTLARGPVHKLDRLMLVRQVHRDVSVFENRLDLFDRLCEPEWTTVVTQLQAHIANALSGRDEVDRAMAADIAKAVVWTYLDRNSRRDLGRFRSRIGAKAESAPPCAPMRRRLWRAASRVPPVRRAAARWRPWSLEGLARPGHPLNADFKAVRHCFENGAG